MGSEMCIRDSSNVINEVYRKKPVIPVHGHPMNIDLVLSFNKILIKVP